MARIVLTCWGSHGDIDPFIGLGLGLRARGHAVTIATIEYYRSLITDAGLGFRPMRPGIDPHDTTLVHRLMDRTRGTEFLLTELLFPSVEQMYEDVEAAAEGADLLVSHPVTFATPVVAERRRLPWTNVVLAPTSFFSTRDIPALPPAPWVKSLERIGHWPGRLFVSIARRVTARWTEPVYSLRRRLGLPPGGHPIFEGQHSPFLVLALFSRVLAQPQPDWPPHTVVTGHAFHDAVHGTTIVPELEAFLSSGPAPIVFTLGSSVVLIGRDFWKVSIDAARAIGMRGVLLAGPEDAPRLQSELQARGWTDIIAVERAPHSLLFPRASAVVQQCGIGTLAQGLRSGRPMLAVPYAHDQADNAWRAAQLGVARTVYPHRYTTRRAASALKDLLEEPSYAAAARRVAEVVRAEAGVQAACEAIERTFGFA